MKVDEKGAPMQAWHMSLGAGLDGLVRRTHARPSPGPGEVLLQVRAVSLNFREIAILKFGRYPLPVKPDVIGLCDGAGEVVALGAGVTRWSPGDRVIASIFPHWRDGPFSLDRAAQLGGSLDGMLAEYVLMPQHALVPVPAHLSDDEAACLPCAGVTAWNALTGGQPLRAGDEVLTQGSGGVSSLAVQLAKAMGARVIAIASSEAKAEHLRQLGADAVVDRRHTPDWSAEVRRLTGGAGVKRAVEIGGAATLPHTLKSMALGGEVGFVGTAAGGDPMIDANLVFASGATLRPVAAGSCAHLAAMARTVALQRLRPPIARVFGFEEAPAALAWYAKGDVLGKVVIRVAPP